MLIDDDDGGARLGDDVGFVQLGAGGAEGMIEEVRRNVGDGGGAVGARFAEGSERGLHGFGKAAGKI